MDNATKRQLKQHDQFVTATEHGIEWARENRQSAITWAVAVVVLLLVGVGGYALFQHRTAAAETAFGDAMQTYQTPVATPGQALPPGTKTFPDTKTRAGAANGQFLAVANQYGSTEPGKLALYFAGLTYLESGQTSQAESTLKKVADSWNGDVASLAKLALAQLYQQTGRASDATTLLSDLSKSNTTTVPSGLAQLELGDMYAAQGKTADAHRIYAEVKDKDKDARGQEGPAGQIASEKLGATK